MHFVGITWTFFLSFFLSLFLFFSGASLHFFEACCFLMDVGTCCTHSPSYIVVPKTLFFLSLVNVVRKRKTFPFFPSILFSASANKHIKALLLSPHSPTHGTSAHTYTHAHTHTPTHPHTHTPTHANTHTHPHARVRTRFTNTLACVCPLYLSFCPTHSHTLTHTRTHSCKPSRRATHHKHLGEQSLVAQEDCVKLCPLWLSNGP